MRKSLPFQKERQAFLLKAELLHKVAESIFKGQVHFLCTLPRVVSYFMQKTDTRFLCA